MKFFSVCAGIILMFQAFALSAADWADPSEKYPNLNLIPWPKTLELHEGKMRLGPNLRIVAADRRNCDRWPTFSSASLPRSPD